MFIETGPTKTGLNLSVGYFVMVRSFQILFLKSAELAHYCIKIFLPKLYKFLPALTLC